MSTPLVKAGDHVCVAMGRGEIEAFVLTTFRVGPTEYSTLCVPSNGAHHVSMSDCDDRFTVRSDQLRLLVQT
jgi:hypothetical protein